MGVVDVALRLIERVRRGERSEEMTQEEMEDPFLARSLQIDEDIRTGKNRPLSQEEQRQFVARIKRGR